ncbi:MULTISPECIES: N-acetylmuramoyl-L-alanine amidase [Asticcacaulis]|uniref:N-acetylmuramoyl-L-alanine amidase family protein n=1 Tax=Asticcacaulis TaxID=76890 RepID=UPI001AE4242D|nr:MULTISPECIES: N-acetylmuramoyl-L-alanine amidase [Asticcacaulis]MBP2158171.1 N-acetylmuramoyl-L-alanine amidase [Asticcacaulis solisilvae]MDR6799216.1 N-acetylmuramoyl-L-alanine amidase [Asticcacaulis sp. BE141]
MCLPADALKSKGVSNFKRLKAVFAAGLVCLAAAVAVPAMAAPSGDVVRVRMGGSGSTTRIVIELDKSAAGKVVSTSADQTRHVLALGDVSMDAPMSGAGQGIIKDWALENDMGSARLKLNFRTGARIYKRFLLPPADGISVYRYVIDVVPGDTPMNTAPKATPVVTATVAQATPVAPAKRKKVIVIDAGHGGKDPGARGSKSWEKDINLAAAKALRDRLEKTGRYKVIMTRDTDSFVDLPARVRIARGADADLFISLHSDSGGDGTARGASIYTLSDSGSERIAKKALVKGDWSLNDMPNDAIVSRILVDLTQRATKNRSATFAQLVMDNIGETTPLLKTSLRQAGFVVLLAPDVPAVLLEMGFVNNAKDEAMLTDSRSRDAMMGQVAKAIDKYFENDVRYASLAGFR